MELREAAINCLNRHSYGRAEYYLRKLVLDNPKDIYMHTQLIWSFYKNQYPLTDWSICKKFYEDSFADSEYYNLRDFVLAEQAALDKNWNDAIVGYNSVIKSGFDSFVIYHCLGVALYNLNKRNEASEAFEKALAITPTFIPSLYAYSKLLFEEGRFYRLENLLVNIDKIDGEYNDQIFKNVKSHLKEIYELKNTVISFRKAITLCNENKFTEAAYTFWPIFLQNKNNCVFIRTIAYFFYRNDWSSIAHKIFNEILSDNNQVLNYANGLMYWYADNFEESLKCYNEAIEGDLKHPLVFCSRARVFRELNRVKDEVDDLTYAYNLQPWLICARSQLAFNALKQSDYDTVLELANIDDSYRQNESSYYISGLAFLADLEGYALEALLNKGENTQALERVKNDKSKINDASLLFRRSMVYASIDNLGKAENELCHATELNPLIIGYAKEKDIELIKNILKHKSESFFAEFSLAIYPFLNNENTEAREKLHKLSEKYPNNELILYYILYNSYILEDWDYLRKEFNNCILLGLSTKDILYLYCNFLSQEKDIQGLLKLAKNLKNETLPLEHALSLTKAKQLDQESLAIAHNILNIDKSNNAATLYILNSIAEKDNINFAKMLEYITEKVPFDFDSRAFIAKKFLENNQVIESIERYDKLLSDRFYSITSVLEYGISCVALKNGS